MVDPRILTHHHGDRTFTSTLYYGADVRESLRKLPDQSVQCIMTGPPYWGQRAYLSADDPLKGQEIGREDTPEQFIQELVKVFREAHRVLRDDGVMWVNINDGYSRGDRDTVPVHRGALASEFDEQRYLFSSPAAKMGNHPTIKPKDLVGTPWMLAFALRADGWYLRQDVIWSKGSVKPESMSDRCTRSHEYVFLLSKSERYFYDHEAVKEPSVTNDKANRNRRTVWHINPARYTGKHSATMPPKLVELCVKAGSRPGDTVLDCFSGTATTGYVANRLGRHYIGTDLNLESLQEAEARLLGMDPPESDDEATPEGEVSVLDLL